MGILMRVLVVMIFLSWGIQAHAVQVPGPLVETDWLAQHQGEVVMLDVRQDIRSFTAEPVYKKDPKTGKQIRVGVNGHIPGAILVNYKQVRATRKIDGQEVTRLIPVRTDFEKLMRQSGVNRDSAIVIVSKGQNNDHLTMATRLYWQLKYFGHDNMGILNGGVAAWLADGRQVASGASKPLPGDWQAGAGRNAILASTADVAAAVKSGDAQLVDTRSLSQYLGTAKKPYVHAMGHIPGAKVYPYELMNAAGESARFLPAEKLGQLMEAMDIDGDAATITYCNSGHLASGGWFIMSELLGNKNVRLYDGSMHEWTLMKQPVKAMQME